MRNTIRCCLSCVLPCGPLDVIRIVHSNGYIEEISGTIRASEIMKANPRHVLKRPASPSYTDEGVVVCLPKIIIISPEVELQRGKVYFLVPTSSPLIHKKGCPKSSSSSTSLTNELGRKRGHVAPLETLLEDHF